MKSALILVDIQNDYFIGGKSELKHTMEAAKNAKSVLNFFRENKLPVYHIQHLASSNEDTFFIPGSYGAEINHLVTPHEEETVLIKHVPNSFCNTGLAEILFDNGIKNIVICGMMTHMCIDTTVRYAKNLGFSITLIEDACTTKDLSWNGHTISSEVVHASYMASLNKVFAEVMTVTKFLENKKEFNI